MSLASEEGDPCADCEALSKANARIAKLEEIIGWCFEYLDAIPKDIVLPVMPGFDRDYANEVYDERLH